ncbi:MAG: DUF393 domain-containing protein [Deltaproteobacteria bacterium]|nr:DUF393 domain-containing protein [Deltaproteobacteria bacterium]
MHIEVPNYFKDIHRPIVFFDGVCNLCNFWVQFIIKRDPHKKFYFASLQSKAGQAILEALGLPDSELNTMIFLEKDQCYLKSSAGLHIARTMGGWLRLGYIFIFIPEGIRNIFYRLISKYRYRYFGKKETCMTPTSDLQDRFLD